MRTTFVCYLLIMVPVVVKQDTSDIVLSNFELILDEQSKEQFFVLEADADSPTSYKISIAPQN